MGQRSRSQNRPSGAVHGVLVVDKPGGMTSHDVVGKARRAFGTRRIGHAGTLDPMATGVLVLLLGEATKLSSVLTTDRKSYIARVQFGVTTDSLDADGKVTKRVELGENWLSDAALEQALAAERARRLQIPPQVSAIKVEGRRAYARAREGQTVDLLPRDVSVHSLDVVGRRGTSLELSLSVSKGYYVRALARDLGSSLGVPAHLTELRRTQSGPFGVLGAHPLPLSGEEELIPITEAARLSLPVLSVTEEGFVRLGQGKVLRPDDLAAPCQANGPTTFAAFFGEQLVALVEPSDSREFRVKRGINDPAAESAALPEGALPT